MENGLLETRQEVKNMLEEEKDERAGQSQVKKLRKKIEITIVFLFRFYFFSKNDRFVIKKFISDIKKKSFFQNKSF